MGTIRNIPVESSSPPFKAMLPFDHRILYLEHVPFLPICFFSGSDSSESEDSSEGGGQGIPVVDETYGELAIYDATGTTLINLLNWGDILINTTVFESCVLKNIGTGPLTITNLNTIGGFEIDSVTPPGLLPRVLAPGETMLVRIGINLFS
jgi:hypothetical protein